MKSKLASMSRITFFKKALETRMLANVAIRKELSKSEMSLEWLRIFRLIFPVYGKISNF